MSAQAAKSEAAEPTIVEVIVEEHQRLRADFNKLESVPESDRDSRESMWAKLKKDLLAHHEAEEEALFANLVQTSDEARHESLHAVSEHGEHKKVLEQMEALSFDDEDWQAKLEELKHDVFHHLEEEEEDVLPIVSDVLSAEKSVELAKRYWEKRG